MDITEAAYPVFAANQVLTDTPLNELFDYLDEQNRLTRANLIGIGIVCGLDVAFDGTDRIHLTKGCGITSEGYLILEPADVDLVAARPYTLPKDYGYPPFAGASPLWELLDDEDENGAVPLTDPLLRLDQKAVVLFLELRRDGLRTCAPNDCDDRGAQVTATLRRLLIDVADLDKIVSAADPAHAYLGADLTERLNLPDLRMPRFDVPNTGPVQTAEVLHAFQEVFRRDQLVAATSAALSALYKAFRPLVVDLFPTDPFSTFRNRFGFLDTNPASTDQVRFLQYYWDLFDDLLAAYDELRWKGVDLLCACCPPAGLFPRHLMVGVLDPVHHDPADYRHQFVRSPAVGDCADRSRQVRQLFRRLVAMTATFREATADHGILATPSRWGDAPLSVKAIPFYYLQRDTPPLYELWDPVRTARRRANQNLSYRATEYVPTPPAFVTDPLRYDLEPNNFLRIEGHLGLDVRSALKILLSLTQTYRLPFDVIALRTGAFDENMSVDLGKEQSRFRDLETLYDALKAELVCFLVKEVEYFYALPDAEAAGAAPVVPTLAILRTHDPDFRAQPGTLGYRIEAALNWAPGRPFPLIILGPGALGLPGYAYLLVGIMSDLATRITDDLRQLDFAAMAEQYRRLVMIATRIEELRRAGVFDAPGLSDRLDDIVFRCRLDPFAALAEEWKQRIRDAKQAQFLGHFLHDHPGIQHKAGVPLGGTFILVYHEASRPTVTGPVIGDVEPDRRTLLEKALGRLRQKDRLADDPDLGFIFRELTGKVLLPTKRPAGVYADAVAALDEGTVIADFFLPYRCGAGCATVPYQPPTRLPVTTTSTCTDGNGSAEVTVTTTGATGAVSLQVDGGSFEELSGPRVLGEGVHTLVVRDSVGAESAPVTIRIPPPLRITQPHPEVNEATGTWQVVFTIDGGTKPYVADVGTVFDTIFTGPSLPVAQVLTVQIKDAVGCTVDGRFESGVTPCELPCGGDAIRQGYRFWLPEPPPGLPINKYAAKVEAFVVVDANGNGFDLTAAVANVVGSAPSSISTNAFGPLVRRWLTAINKLVAQAVGSDQWLTFAYEPPQGGATTGSLFADRLRCVTFDFRIVVSFEQGQRPHQLRLSYSTGGTTIDDFPTESKAWVPGFTISTSNKCRPDEDPVPQCEGTDLKVDLRHEGVHPGMITLKPVLSGADVPAVYFWEIQDGIPALSNNDVVSVRFDPPEPVEKLVVLTVFTEKGCAVTGARTIDISTDHD